MADHATGNRTGTIGEAVSAFQPILLDRAAEVPLGTQLTWVLRARVTGGALAPGERLPGARELAAHVGVNVNTVRAVFARLEEEGLLEVVHGRGTFVADRGAAARPGADAAARFAAAVTSEARRRGLDPRAVAAALYVEAGGDDAAVRALPAGDDSDRGALRDANTTPADPTTRRALRDANTTPADATTRRALRDEIAALERRLAELPAPPPGGDPLALPPLPPSAAGRLLTTAELERERDRLAEQVAAAAARTTPGDLDADDRHPAAAAERRSPAASRRAPAPAGDRSPSTLTRGGRLRWVPGA